jgi:Domain of unknown function (DUF4286)
MLIYSVTIMIEKDIEADWLRWMQEVHVPDVMRTGYFSESNFHQLLEPEPEPGTSTYNIQYTCIHEDAYQQYLQTDGNRLRQEVADRYGNRFVAFRTLLRRFS